MDRFRSGTYVDEAYGEAINDCADELLSALDAENEPIAWLAKNKKTGVVELAEPNEKASNPEYWTDAFPVFK